MNPAHIHLMLNHFPVVGTFLCLILQIIATTLRSVELKKGTLYLLVATGAMAGLVYFTGEEAEAQLLNFPGILRAAVLSHDDAAFYAVVAAILCGLVALSGLTLFRRTAFTCGWFWPTSLILTVITAALMAWTANLGGHIRHPEIRNQVRLFTPAPRAISRVATPAGDPCTMP